MVTLTVVKTDGAELSGQYHYLEAMARLEHASAQETFCHAEIRGAGISCGERSGVCPHSPIGRPL